MQPGSQWHRPRSINYPPQINMLNVRVDMPSSRPWPLRLRERAAMPGLRQDVRDRGTKSRKSGVTISYLYACGSLGANTELAEAQEDASGLLQYFYRSIGILQRVHGDISDKLPADY